MRYVDIIAQAAEKGRIANHWYDRGRTGNPKSFVDEAQANGQTNYKQDEKIDAVQERDELLGFSPTITVDTRSVSSLKRYSTYSPA